jgi:alkylhydroperoxidase family enzyme
MSVTAMADIQQARKLVIARILEGDGRAPQAQRRAAFDNTGLADPLRTLVDKVARHAHRVTDADIDAARSAGFTEDQIFEVVVCAAIGQANRQYDSANAALEAASNKG